MEEAGPLDMCNPTFKRRQNLNQPSEEAHNIQRRNRYAEDKEFQRQERHRCKYAMRRLRILRKHEASPLETREHTVRLKDAAAILGVSVDRVLRLVEQGMLPKPLRQGTGGYRAFNLSDLVAATEALQ